MFFFKLDINKCKDIEKKQIQAKIQQNTKNISNYEKRKEALKFFESTTNTLLPKNFGIYGKDYRNQNDVNNKLLIEKNNEEEKLYPTVHNYKNEKSKFKKQFKIDINSLKEEEEQNIIEKKKEIKDPYLSDYQKRKKVLQDLKTITNDIRDQQIYIEVNKIKEQYENDINAKKDKNKNLIQNEYEKRKIAIEDNESSTDYVNVKKTDLSNISLNSYNHANDSSFLSEQSTWINSKNDISQNSNESNQNQNPESPQKEKEKEKEKKKEKKFNNLRTNYYIKNKLNDISYYEKDTNKENAYKYWINEDENLYAYLYPNDYSTYCIIKSRYLGEDKIINEDNDKDINLNKFDKSTGLYFCGKEIKIDNETKICTPNVFMCKECMEINKKRYNIKDKYLINIKGRVAKINKGGYHCFGKFLSSNKENQIEDCISKYTCKACQLLNKCSHYYN